jgi:deazaflavin-dependent oxidoreductase (nitroreductase family)
MPAPRWLAHFNKRLTNRLTSPLATWLPGFGIVVHRGRKSGQVYRTPVNVFARPGAYVVALTYGPDSQWVRNVLASGGCSLITRGRRVQLTNPRLRHDAQRRAMPAPVRVILGLVNVSDFLELEVTRTSAQTSPAGGTGESLPGRR